jgi:2-iminobutanoate/2-iminopropanoate deaminase
MPTEFLNPATLHDTAGRYAHAALITGAGGRRLVVSGQVGMAADGTIPPGGEAQIAQALANLRAILDAAAMTPAQIVKVVVYLTDRSLIGPWRSGRSALLGGHVPASTLLIVAGLADPAFLVEIEIEAID